MVWFTRSVEQDGGRAREGGVARCREGGGQATGGEV